ncbi:MAG: hypothetical protein GC188_02480 [Alphaproteobacteria bacterium]|nr:hypothetical protein [Alphaproteobacteria bacterium]
MLPATGVAAQVKPAGQVAAPPPPVPPPPPPPPPGGVPGLVVPGDAMLEPCEQAASVPAAAISNSFLKEMPKDMKDPQ